MHRVPGFELMRTAVERSLAVDKTPNYRHFGHGSSSLGIEINAYGRRDMGNIPVGAALVLEQHVSSSLQDSIPEIHKTATQEVAVRPSEVVAGAGPGIASARFGSPLQQESCTVEIFDGATGADGRGGTEAESRLQGTASYL